jgi:hypothetical protein
MNLAGGTFVLSTEVLSAVNMSTVVSKQLSVFRRNTLPPPSSP